MTFAPTVVGARTGTLTLAHNATGAGKTSTTVALTGTGVGVPAISITPATTLDFLQIQQGTSSTAQSVTIKNTGTGNLVFSSLTSPPAAGANTVAGEFILGTATGACSATSSLIPNGTCTVTATFSPSLTSATGAKTATVTIAHNAGASSVITLKGTSGAATSSVSSSASTVAFGSITVGSTATPQTVTLTNSGQAALAINSIAWGTAGAGDFGQTNTCGTSVAANGGNCVITFSYKPTTAVASNATLTVNSNASNTPALNIAVSGTGVTQAVSTIQLAPASLSFAATTINTTPVTKTFAINNIGQASLTVSSITVSGTAAGDYTTSGCVNTAVAAGMNCTVTVSYKPTAVGTASGGNARTATVSVVSNANNATAGGDKVSLTGDAVAAPVAVLSSSITASPATIAFPDTTVGASAAGIAFTITNTSTANAAGTAAAPLTISGITLSGTNMGEFTVTTAPANNCGGSLAGGASCTVTVVFKPSAVNARSANLVIANNDTTKPSYTVSLSGNGLAAPAPALTLNMTTMAFGNQLVGTASGVQTVTVSNTGTADLTVSTVTSSDTVFAVKNNGCTAPLAAAAAGASPNVCYIDVVFTPTATGGKTGNLTISGSGQTGTVAMTGTGLAATGGAVNGQALYMANCSSSGCHSTNVVNNVNRVQVGLVAGAISNAIAKNMGGMGSLSNLTTSELNDIAAYIGVQLGQPSSPISTTPAQGGGTTPATTNVGGGGCTIANNDGTTQLPIDPLLLLMVGISAAVLVRRQMKR